MQKASSKSRTRSDLERFAPYICRDRDERGLRRKEALVGFQDSHGSESRDDFESQSKKSSSLLLLCVRYALAVPVKGTYISYVGGVHDDVRDILAEVLQYRGEHV